MSESQRNGSVARMFVSSPLLVVVGVAVLVVFVMTFFGYVKKGGFWSPEVEARVFTQKVRGRDGQDGAAGTRRMFVFQGEVYEDAERLREASSLAAAATIVATQQVLDGRPLENVSSLFSALGRKEVLPPDMVVDMNSWSVKSTYGMYYVRYRAEPVGVEVLSVGTGRADEAPLLVRLPDDGFSQNALTYYVGRHTEGAALPPGFASASQIINLGWRPEAYKSAALSAEEVQKERAWVSTESAAKKQ